jgi:hypothetical protein
MKRIRASIIAVAVACSLASTASAVFAQRRGGGGPAMPGGDFPYTRLELLEENFKLDGEKKRAVKAALDEAHKNAAPVREALLKTHADLGAAVQAGKTPAEIDAAAQAYGEQAAAMAAIEMDAIAKVIAIADPELQNPPAIQAAFFMARGMFLKKNKWDEIPERNVPSY